MRGIVVIDTIAKILQSILRERYIAVATQWRSPLQLGGYKNQQTLYATHFARDFLLLARQTHLSTAVLYVDLKAAFRSLVREQTFSGGLLSLPLRAHLIDAGFDVDAIQALTDSLTMPFRETASLALQRMMVEIHTGTWFRLSRSQRLWETFKGSRPGSPIADVAFNSMVSHLMQEVTDRVRAIPSIADAAKTMDCPVETVAWVDDLTIPFAVPTADALDDALCEVVDILQTACQCRGLTLNFQAGKTEAMVQYRGTNSDSCRHRRLIECSGTLHLRDGTDMNVAATYQHLGTAVCEANSIDQEIKTRIQKATVSVHTISKGVLRNKHIPKQTRLALYHSGFVAWSRQLASAQSCPDVNSALPYFALATGHSGINIPCRGVC